MREIVLDTETTGLDPASGDRIVEIGCVELVNHLPTGQTFQAYVNPERDVPTQAFAVHGLSREFLSAHPVFAGVAGTFLEFVADSRLIIHNAAFDLGFVNAELARLDMAPLLSDRAVDTVQLARRKFPGAPANLDALCSRFGVDLADRTLHGALKDALLLAQVYLELIGGRQPDLSFLAKTGAKTGAKSGTKLADGAAGQPARAVRAHAPTDAETAAHAAFLAKLKNPAWSA